MAALCIGRESVPPGARSNRTHPPDHYMVCFDPVAGVGPRGAPAGAVLEKLPAERSSSTTRWRGRGARMEELPRPSRTGTRSRGFKIPSRDSSTAPQGRRLQDGTDHHPVFSQQTPWRWRARHQCRTRPSTTWRLTRRRTRGQEPSAAPAPSPDTTLATLRFEKLIGTSHLRPLHRGGPPDDEASSAARPGRLRRLGRPDPTGIKSGLGFATASGSPVFPTSDVEGAGIRHGGRGFDRGIAVPPNTPAT